MTKEDLIKILERRKRLAQIRVYMNYIQAGYIDGKIQEIAKDLSKQLTENTRKLAKKAVEDMQKIGAYKGIGWVALIISFVLVITNVR